MSLYERPEENYSREITSDEELKEFVKEALENGVLSESTWGSLKPATDEILGLEDAVANYRHDVKQLSKNKSERTHKNLKITMKELLSSLIDAIEHSAKAHNQQMKLDNQFLKDFKGSEMDLVFEKNAVTSINKYLIDKLLVNEIEGLVKPDEYLLNLDMTPPIKLLEKEKPQVIKRLMSIINSRRSSIKDKDLKIIDKEISINNPYNN